MAIAALCGRWGTRPGPLPAPDTNRLARTPTGVNLSPGKHRVQTCSLSAPRSAWETEGGQQAQAPEPQTPGEGLEPPARQVLGSRTHARDRSRRGRRRGRNTWKHRKLQSENENSLQSRCPKTSLVKFLLRAIPGPWAFRHIIFSKLGFCSPWFLCPLLPLHIVSTSPSLIASTNFFF